MLLKFSHFTFREFGSKSKPLRFPLNKIYKLKNAPEDEELPEIGQLDIAVKPEDANIDDQEPQPSAEPEEDENIAERMDQLVSDVKFC
jgi:hypothetical protein